MPLSLSLQARADGRRCLLERVLRSTVVPLRFLEDLEGLVPADVSMAALRVQPDPTGKPSRFASNLCTEQGAFLAPMPLCLLYLLGRMPGGHSGQKLSVVKTCSAT